MTKSELIDRLAQRQTYLSHKDVELAVKLLLEHICQSLAQDERIEIRGFGSFSLHHRPPRVGRNPKTGDPVNIPPKRVPHFKPGKEMEEKVRQLEEQEAAKAAARHGASMSSDSSGERRPIHAQPAAVEGASAYSSFAGRAHD